MKKTIRFRIITTYTALILILIAVISVFFNDLFHDRHLDVIRREMHEKLKFIHLVMRDRNLTARHYQGNRLRETINSLSEIIGLRITIVTLEGAVAADSDVSDERSIESHRYRPEIIDALKGGYGDNIRYSHTLSMNMLYSAEKIGDTIIRVAKPLTEIEESLQRLRRMIMLVSLLTFSAAFAIIVVLTRRLVNPIVETISFARQFAAGDYTKRFLNYRDDELGELQRSLNKMADSLVEKITNLIFEQNKLSATLESISDGIAVVGSNKKIIISNTAFNEYFDYRQRSEQRLYFEVIRSREMNARVEESIQKGEEIQFEETLATGKVFAVNVKPIRGEKNLQGILIVMHDITEKKRIEQMKTDLVGNMSHELKTPITIIKGYLETIRENIGDPVVSRGFIQKAIENADRQNTLINDILLLNELETSSDFVFERLEVEEIIENCVELLGPKAAARGIQMAVSLDMREGDVRGNRFLAEEIFFNIIDNAISYNVESGRVTITSENRNGRFFIRIEDTGIGIPVESLDRIFERFYRVDKSRSRATGGTGLGLSIVKHAADIMGWDMSVASGDAGTQFTVIL